MKDSIVFFAPNSRIAALATNAISQMNLSIPVEEAIDYEAVELLHKYPSCKVAISRSGTADLLRGVKGLSVVDITASYYEIQRGISNLIEKRCKNISVISQHNFIGLTHAEFNVGDVKVTLNPCKNTEDIISTVERRVDCGTDGVLGCVLAIETAKSHNLIVEPLESDFFSIKKVILQALEMLEYLNVSQKNFECMESVLDNIDEGVIFFDSDNKPAIYNESALKLMQPESKEQWFHILEDYMNRANNVPRVVNLNQNKVLFRSIPLSGNKFISGNKTSSNVVIMQDSTAIEENAKNIKISSYEKGLFARRSFKDIRFESLVMEDAVALAKRFSNSDSTVMLFGETGVGKEGFAQSIHNNSPRAKKPFVSVNCASLPQGLVASELFGYAEGAFTGARSSGKKGLFELAQGGTIFLDEITEIPLEVQSQFLRVIQEREVMRIGDDRIIPLDIRIICASNKKILPLCEQGKFRYDLYYRLNVLQLTIPPLRERSRDVLVLFKAFMAEFLHKNEEYIEFEDSIRSVLLTYSWPGNVRELRNFAEALSFYGDEIKLSNVLNILNHDKEVVSAGSDGGQQVLNFKDDMPLAEIEKEYYRYMLERHSNAEVAKLAGISRTSLWRKLKTLGLSD
ncbi:Transcriptional regulator containing PAS, AAA-type ATPase, and DNA-binding Fis domains [Succinivibrio dextrinosolvens DSM 3072]|uniref:Transcriptional regulator containing PAS, AAA-type ATPase, and DNA-binding Fis domains n=1 Tax=Succinivibrio dextrinosolvens DSM 3072 TaxID=1123324 RepID=A0A1T4V4X5_9GAMM|nr:sigma 54-interacting transcriptional regulator [Succinivibrio dextrinosolvens]SKA59977.1 Transcriptional regulator containing PAS, AAA-type ATPase, and DNA-binding Fis domains [Succinivibrio dextrinosolvens DSM 3072]